MALTPEFRIVVDEEFLQAQRVFAIAQECFEDSRRSAGFQYEALCLQSGDAGESFGQKLYLCYGHAVLVVDEEPISGQSRRFDV